MKTTMLTSCALVMALLAGSPGHAAEKHKKSGGNGLPDLTMDLTGVKDPDVQDWKNWVMGPTGARIWVWANHKTICSDGATQIYVVKVDAKTPASGKLLPGDVILGAGGGEKAVPFARNARTEVGQAITDAETAANKGQLSLLVWRSGTTNTVTLTLPVVGSFSSTSPADCEKTRRVVDQIASRIAERGALKETGIPDYLNALGLLATGDEKYLPVLRDFARKIGPPDLKVDLGDIEMWSMAYKMIFLAEYYSATKDDAVLPALREIATKMAMGSSIVGTWGHRVGGVVSSPWTNGGKPYRVAAGYGGMNAVGVPVTIGLVLAQKCGIHSPEIDTAVHRSADFIRYFAEKGCVPYGDHDPYMGSFDDNGKNAMAAVLFDLLGEKEVASYFTSMVLASVREREDGHTGPYFSIVWGGLGAACGGDTAISAYMKDLRWYYELMRRPNGDSRYQPVLRGGQEMGAYGRSPTWSTAGATLMHYCAPRRKIFLTGKGGRANPPMTDAQIQDCLRVCVKDFYKDCKTDDLVKLLEHRLPVTRRRAAVELGSREDNVVPQLIAMLESPDRYARFGACEGLRYASRNSPEAADALVARALNSSDYNLRYFAVLAFGRPNDSHGFDSEAKKAGPALLKLAATDDLQNDPMRKLQQTLSLILTYSGSAAKFTGVYPNAKGLEQMDRALLYPAIRSFFTNPNGGARDAGARICTILKEDELEHFWGDIYKAAREQAPSGDQFGGVTHRETLRMLATHRFKEVIDVIVYNSQHPRHGGKGYIPTMVGYLKYYGTLAKPVLPTVREAAMKAAPKNAERKKFLEDLDKTFKDIESSTETPEVRSIEKYLKEPKANENK